MMASTFDSIASNLGVILFVTFVFGGWTITAIVRSVCESWRRVRENEQNAVLKQSMIERGMSAEEIERVIVAGQPKPETEE